MLREKECAGLNLCIPLVESDDQVTRQLAAIYFIDDGISAVI
jgi:hypothetical protein